MREVLTRVRSGLAQWGRVDAGHALNDRAAHPQGAYLPLEHALLRLATVRWYQKKRGPHISVIRVPTCLYSHHRSAS
jgi:hypothetical protein